MALKPSDLTLSPEEVLRADNLERTIDGELRRSSAVAGSDEVVTIGVGLWPPKVISEIVRRYKAAGWSEIKYVNKTCMTFKQ